MNKRFKTWIRQPSTWKAIVIMLGLCGCVITPERVGEVLRAQLL